MTKDNWLYCEFCGRERRADGDFMRPHQMYDSSICEMIPCEGITGSTWSPSPSNAYHVDSSALSL
jgi:hypothetical protein